MIEQLLLVAEGAAAGSAGVRAAVVVMLSWALGVRGVRRAGRTRSPALGLPMAELAHRRGGAEALVELQRGEERKLLPAGFTAVRLAQGVVLLLVASERCHVREILVALGARGDGGCGLVVVVVVMVRLVVVVVAAGFSFLLRLCHQLGQLGKRSTCLSVPQEGLCIVFVSSVPAARGHIHPSSATHICQRQSALTVNVDSL